MDKINVLNEGFVSTVVMEVITDHNIINKLIEQTDFNSNEVEVELTINGIKCSLVPFLEDVEKRLDYYIEEKAKEILEEKYIDKITKLNNCLSDIEEKMENIIHG